MPSISIDVTDEEYEALLQAAGEKGQSVEECARSLLTDAFVPNAEGGIRTVKAVGLPREKEEGPFLVKDDEDIARENPNRIIATFNRQEWTGTHLEQLRQIEKQYWDVTDEIERLVEEEGTGKVKDLIDNDYSTDNLLRDHVQHDGPFSVRVTDQIQTYWRHTRGEPLWE
jgi:hypothetical protein